MVHQRVLRRPGEVGAVLQEQANSLDGARADRLHEQRLLDGLVGHIGAGLRLQERPGGLQRGWHAHLAKSPENTNGSCSLAAKALPIGHHH